VAGRREPEGAAVSSEYSARRPTAVHEAGHAVLAFGFELPMRSISIIRDGAAGIEGEVDLPFTSDVWPGDTPGDFEETLNRITVLLAGKIAAWRFCGARNDAGARHDIEEAWKLAGAVTRSDAEARALLEWLRCRATGLVEFLRVAIEALAQVLLEVGALSADEAGAVIRAALEP